MFFLLRLKLCEGYFFIMYVFGQNFAIISSNVQHHEISQMSPWLPGSLMMLYKASYFQNSASQDISDVTLAFLISYDALLSIILRFKHLFVVLASF